MNFRLVGNVSYLTYQERLLVVSFFHMLLEIFDAVCCVSSVGIGHS